MFPSRLYSGPQRGLWRRWIRIKEGKAGTASAADISTLMATVWKGRGYVRTLATQGRYRCQSGGERSSRSRVTRSEGEYSLLTIIDLIKFSFLTSTTRPQSHKTWAPTRKVISLIKEWCLVSMVTQANNSDMFLSQAGSLLLSRQKVEGPESPRDQTKDEHCSFNNPAQLRKVNKWRSHLRMRAMVVSATSTDSSSGSSWIPFGNRRFSITTDSSLVSMLYSNTLAENRTATGF